MYLVRDISCGCDMSLRDEKKEFISYRNGMKWSYIAFEKQIYRTNEVSISQKEGCYDRFKMWTSLYRM